jgi:hypothetical protein
MQRDTYGGVPRDGADGGGGWGKRVCAPSCLPLLADVPPAILAQGVCTFANSDVYTGGWHADLREGQGSLAFANGDHYEGAWMTDMRWGKGEQKYATGSWYKGDWLNDMEHGTGKAFLQVPQRGIYEGDFLDGAPSGVGKFAYANGDVYAAHTQPSASPPTAVQRHRVTRPDCCSPPPPSVSPALHCRHQSPR